MLYYVSSLSPAFFVESGCSHDTRDDLVQPSNLIVHLCICYIYSPTHLHTAGFLSWRQQWPTPFLLASPSTLPWLQRARHKNISNHPFNSVHGGCTLTRFLPVFELFFSFKTSSHILNRPHKALIWCPPCVVHISATGSSFGASAACMCLFS